MKLNSIINYSVILSVILVGRARADSLPVQPTALTDPGSAAYSYSLYHDKTTLNGRSVEFFAPAEIANSAQKVPLVVFGHGQALGADNYRLTFEHLAKKGVAVFYPTYDTGFFDQNWIRMGQDYLELTQAALSRYSHFVDPTKVVFSGHSKGGYIALNAAGLAGEQGFSALGAVVVFEPAGYLAEQLGHISAKVPVTVTFGDHDTIIKASLVQEIYDGLAVTRKQLIHVSSYLGTDPQLMADHFFILSQAFFMGGQNGVGPFHFYGVWKWLLGATGELQNNGAGEYLYGNQASNTGVATQVHQIDRNFQ